MLVLRDLLVEMKRLLTEVAPDVALQVGPGLADEEMDDLLEPHDLSLPDEARTWWRTLGSDKAALFDIGAFVPLERALELRMRNHELERDSADSAGVEFGARYRLDWLPILYSGGMPEIVVACGEDPLRAPVYHFDWSASDGHEPPAFLSLTDMVAKWNIGLRHGGVIRDDGMWDIKTREFSALWF